MPYAILMEPAPIKAVNAERLAARQTQLQEEIHQNDRDREMLVAQRNMLAGALLEIERLLVEAE